MMNVEYVKGMETRVCLNELAKEGWEVVRSEGHNEVLLKRGRERIIWNSISGRIISVYTMLYDY